MSRKDWRDRNKHVETIYGWKLFKMIGALKRIGEANIRDEFNLSSINDFFWEKDYNNLTYLLSEDAFNYDYFEKQVENPLKKPHVLILNLITAEDNSINYFEVKIIQANRSNNNNWIKKEAIGGKYLTPSIPLEISSSEDSMYKNATMALQTIKKTFDIGKSKKIQNIYTKEIKNQVKFIQDYFDAKKNEICSEITKEILELFFTETNLRKKDINIIISLKINGEAIKENEVLSEYIFHKFIDKNLKIFDSFSKGKISWNNNKGNKYCSVCTKKNVYISTDYKPYTFYSKDKPSYNTNSYLMRNSGEMFPICMKCAILVEIGRCYIDRFNEFKLADETFKLIPKILFPVNEHKSKRILYLRNRYNELMNREERITRRNQETNFLVTLEDFSNTINFDMIFYEKIQSEFRILQHIKDVAPSRIKKIHDAMEKSRQFGNSYGRNYGNLLSFYSIKRFFSRYEGEKIKYDTESFLNTLDIIFSGKKIKKNSLMVHFNKNLSNKLYNAKEGPTKALESSAHSTILFFELLKELKQMEW